MKKRILAMTLSICLVSQLVVTDQTVYASENSIVVTQEDIEEAQQRVIDAAEYNVSDKDSDGDGLVDEWEKVMETDPFNQDTDGDGLSDYKEVFVLGTDPCLADTDDNGINDANEDADGDGLTNIEELKLGTNPTDADTDRDLINDYDEVYIFGTDPLKADSNNDGESDFEANGFSLSTYSVEEDEVESMLNDDNMISMLPEGSNDFNNDGISDEYTKMMCDGTIKTSNGELVFGDMTYEEVQNYTDLDSDTLANGEEITLHEYNGEMVVKVISNPTLLDTDADGINDADDTAPLTRGLKGGIIGQLRQIARYDENKMFLDGHAYLVFTSYINGVTISVDDLDQRYNYIGSTPISEYNSNNEIELSFENEVDSIKEDNRPLREAAANAMWQFQEGNSLDQNYTLNRGQFVSIGNYNDVSVPKAALDAVVKSEEIGELMDVMVIKAIYDKITGKDVSLLYIVSHFAQVVAIVTASTVTNSKDYLTGVTEGGICYNRELYNQKLEYLQCPNAVYEIDITQEQLDRMAAFLSNNSYYSIVTHNCSTVSAGAWNAAVGYDYDNLVDGNYAKTQYWINSRATGLYSGFDLPMAVKSYIKTMSDNPSDNAKVYKDGMRIVRGTEVTNAIASEHENLGFVEETDKLEENITVEDNSFGIPVISITDENGKLEIQVTDTITVDDIKQRLEDATNVEGNEGLKNLDLDKAANSLANIMKALGKFKK